MSKEPVQYTEILAMGERVNVRLSLPKIKSIGQKLCAPADRVLNEFIPEIQKMRKTKQIILERDKTRKEKGTISDRMFNASFSKHSKDFEMLVEIEEALFASSNALESAVEIIQRHAGS